jgi:hypothetical protein
MECTFFSSIPERGGKRKKKLRNKLTSYEKSSYWGCTGGKNIIMMLFFDEILFGDPDNVCEEKKYHCIVLVNHKRHFPTVLDSLISSSINPDYNMIVEESKSHIVVLLSQGSSGYDQGPVLFLNVYLSKWQYDTAAEEARSLRCIGIQL